MLRATPRITYYTRIKKGVHADDLGVDLQTSWVEIPSTPL